MHQHMHNLQHWIGRRSFGAHVLVALVLAACALILAVSVGSVSIPFALVMRTLWASWWPMSAGDIPQQTQTIIMTIRVPRVLLVGLTGAALSATGAAYQGLFRNALADPYIIGVASGAGLGAIGMVAIGGIVWLGSLALPVGAFVGALAVVGIVFGIAARRRVYSNNDLILAGIALGTLASAMTTFVMIQLGRQTTQLLAFLLGSFANVGWDAVWIVAVSVLIGLVCLAIVARDLNVLLFSEEQALFLGVNVVRVRWLAVLGATVMSATAVAFHGLIGFVGIIVPHSLRLLIGSDHRRLIPLAAVYGGVFLMLADLLARTLLAPRELPLGIVTAAIGAPFFLWQLMTTKRGIV